MSGEEDGWNEWRQFVLNELKRLNDCHEKSNQRTDHNQSVIFKEIKKIAVEIGMLKVKSGVWGAIGASVPLLIFTAIQFLMRMKP